MPITGSSTRGGQDITLVNPLIKIGGVELAGGVQSQDERVSFYRDTKQISGTGTLTFTTTDLNVDLHYTFNGRNPTSKSPKYTGAITLTQNTTGDNTVVKVRAFSQTNSNLCSKIIKATLNVA